MREPAAAGGLADRTLAGMPEVLVEELRAEDGVVGIDVVDAARPGEDEIALLVVGPDVGAGLEDEGAVGLHVDDLGLHAGGEAVAAVDGAFALEIARSGGPDRRDRGPDAAARDLGVAELELDELLEPGVELGFLLQLGAALGAERTLLAHDDRDLVVLAKGPRHRLGDGVEADVRQAGLAAV